MSAVPAVPTMNHDALADAVQSRLSGLRVSVEMGGYLHEDASPYVWVWFKDRATYMEAFGRLVSSGDRSLCALSAGASQRSLKVFERSQRTQDAWRAKRIRSQEAAGDNWPNGWPRVQAR